MPLSKIYYLILILNFAVSSICLASDKHEDDLEVKSKLLSPCSQNAIQPRDERNTCRGLLYGDSEAPTAFKSLRATKSTVFRLTLVRSGCSASLSARARRGGWGAGTPAAQRASGRNPSPAPPCARNHRSKTCAN